MIFYLLLLCNMLMLLSISVISPFFPPFALDFGVSQDTIGQIIGANPLGSIFATLILGKIMNERNRVNFMIVGLLMQATGMFGFALTYIITQMDLFISASIISRILSGMGASFFTTPFYALIPIMYPTQMERYIALAEMGAAFGLLLGPIFGSLLYSVGGYPFPFLFFGGLVFIFAPLLFILLKRKEVRDSRSFLIEKMKEEDDMRFASQTQSPKKGFRKMSIENSWPGNSQPGRAVRSRIESEQVYLNTSIALRHSTEMIQLGYFKLFSDYKIFINYIMVIAVNFVIMYFAPTFAAYLEYQYDIGSDQVGFYMSAQSVTYLQGCMIIMKIKNFKQMYIFFCTLILGIAFYFQGPTDMLFPLKPNIIIVLAAQAVSGYGISFIFILTLPYLNDLVTTKSKDPQQCANMASALYNNGMAVGEFLGPWISGILTQKFGFPDASAYVGFALLALSILYLPILLY